MGFPLQGDGAYGSGVTAGRPLFLHCWQMELLAYPGGTAHEDPVGKGDRGISDVSGVVSVFFPVLGFNR